MTVKASSQKSISQDPKFLKLKKEAKREYKEYREALDTFKECDKNQGFFDKLFGSKEHSQAQAKMKAARQESLDANVACLNYQLEDLDDAMVEDGLDVDTLSRTFWVNDQHIDQMELIRDLEILADHRTKDDWRGNLANSIDSPELYAEVLEDISNSEQPEELTALYTDLVKDHDQDTAQSMLNQEIYLREFHK